MGEAHPFIRWPLTICTAAMNHLRLHSCLRPCVVPVSSLRILSNVASAIAGVQSHHSRR